MLKPPYLTKGDLAEKANEFRLKYVTPQNQIPLDIEYLIESVLKIKIDPRENLSRFFRKNNLAIDAFLTYDRSTIIIDYDQFIQDQGRLKFTLAHELGHWYLHKKEYESINYKSEDDFIKVQKSIEPKFRNHFEIQANEFAAQLLVPKDILYTLMLNHKKEIKKFVVTHGDRLLWMLRADLSDELSQEFGVSSEVVNNRISNDQIIEELLQS
jgi:Zn-dependent peptidase ImmA (M78 family)